MTRSGAFLPTFWDDYGATSIHAAITETALAAEALGYEGVWANDSVIKPAAAVRGTVEGGQVIEPLITLASLVHLVPRLTLGTAVLVLPQRHPVLVAKQAAALHLLSGGRLILGIGTGWREAEFAMLDADFANCATTTSGRAAHLDRGQCARRDTRAAQYGSGWLPYCLDLGTCRAGVATLRDLTRGRGYPTIANMFYFRIEKPNEPTNVRSTSPWMAGRFGGSVDAVTLYLERYRRVGLEYAL